MTHKRLIKNNKRKQNNSFSIIAGKYRRLKFDFSGDISLRPTPNKVRETLFNWLGFDIVGKTVLDSFAGSGALGFEAISRGAKNVVLLEKNPQTQILIKQNILKLKDENITIICDDFFKYNFKHTFDIILLDPPFNLDLIDKSIDIIKNNIANDNTLIYFESEFELKNTQIQIIKQKKSASVHYALGRIK